MSIIERAAELLASASQRQQKLSPSSERADEQQSRLIERAAKTLAKRTPQASDGGASAKPGSRVMGARPGASASRVVAIDRDRLRLQSMIVPDSGRTAIAEGFRRVKRQVLANAAGAAGASPPANLVMVTSSLSGEGKTFCAINLAISLAMEVDRTVLLVDADVAKSDVPKALGLQADKGLMDVLLDPQVDLADVLWKTDVGKLSVLPVGTANEHATELLASEAMSALLQEIAVRYRDRIVIFDSPPLLAASEASALAGQMGQIVLVVEAGKTPENVLKDALARVDSSRLTGLLLNKGQERSHEYGQYGYG